jgi:elongation factor Ts
VLYSKESKMSVISATLVKELREKSGAGMMDCKKALAENNGDLEVAMDWLRTKGLAKAAKKSDRVAAEGLVALAVSETTGVAVEVNSETDFVARNEHFQNMVSQIAAIALKSQPDVDSILASACGTQTVSETISSAIASIGENMTLRRVQKISVNQGVVSSYVHNQVAPQLGKIAVLVALESSNNSSELAEFGKQIAMHIAAINPVALTPDQVDPALVEREKSVLAEKARESGKPENIIEKIVESGIKSYYKEVCLLDQPFVLDSSKTIAQAVEAKGKELGADVRLTAYIRMQLGEGIEKVQADFAAEVAAAVNG